MSQRLKQFAVSLAVVIVFILYSYSQRHDDTSAAVVPPKSLTSQSSSSSSGSGSTTSGSGSSGSTAATVAYKDGSYTGDAADAYYGLIQVKAVIQGGKITDVQFLQYPNDRQNSIEINTQAMPYLKQEAIQAQSSSVDIVSGATDSSQAFIESLGSALSQAK